MDRTRERATHLLRWLGPALVVSIGAVSIATIWVRPEYMERWFTGAGLAYSIAVPLLVLAAGALSWRALHTEGRVAWPFLATISLFALTFAGLGISFYPNIVPPALTIAETAAPDASLRFLLVGAAVLIPTILAYTGYSYWVFRGPVRAGEGYHA